MIFFSHSRVGTEKPGSALPGFLSICRTWPSGNFYAKNLHAPRSHHNGIAKDGRAGLDIGAQGNFIHQGSGARKMCIRDRVISLAGRVAV